ncbi:hypothetical protein A2331_06125 [Candidatus Falkowbacteria bacterium RIFOXYB2_FULL_34_18]|uniref:General secretion pathway GspH domain-containing protein n=1 Tax=Candidatus Falkowbacteria bacterium RIFOXYD2_FULL_34_120 TaxID=1798007 RepID=A0A1F5TNL3_9BACT|nr:MAG: hypothetical protein A2331_06125 [Candidatus Falkowbacteria bacterium RIFOXYB2_FULL_34_18]OGF28981.1 MAG: hypothetical protein A2500_01800 [Candidatus Falkowbacteria bacterium RIFOXYC12_FULL_34_55]OGF35899.1 MAG: hypothetical protein A2466_02340 [Candidatus Falkowbacteria bacterium RIFOXYC2_FULL_34_220]OGF38496.1 MAG: hypothetical protein A2515_03125 [Candidatus Falkowbacteria bacterium RIFOXYD12_FULL_34_57]OGF40575.1 MAG: hypothetical protein A2531_03530 [Candidatus Falkowbacteria bact
MKNKFLKIKIKPEHPFSPDGERGYTLAEMIVSVAIIAIIASIILANFSEFRKGGDVAMAAQLLSSDIRTAQGHALSIRKHKNDVDTASPVGSWGIYLANSFDEYYIYGDLNQDSNYNGGAELDKAIPLPKNIIINQIQLSATGIVLNANILFEPPRPDTILNTAGAGAEDSIQVELKDITSGETKRVVVNKFGLVDVQN